MKKILLSCFIALLFEVSSYNVALTQTPSISSSPIPTEEEMKQVEKIKDLVASRVAELKLVEKKGILGKVNSSTSTQITLTDGKKQKRIVDIDEITKFSDPADKTFGVSDIKPGNLIGVIGLYNKSSGHLLARMVEKTASIPEYFDGVVVGLDKINFQLSAIDENGKTRIIDIVPTTKTSSFTTDGGQIKSGFSKITVGERVYAAGFPDAKKETQLNATRVTHFPELPLSVKMKHAVDANTQAQVTPQTTP